MKSIALYDNLTVFLILNMDKNIVKISYFDYFMLVSVFCFSGLNICRKQLMKIPKSIEKATHLWLNRLQFLAVRIA